MADKTNKFDDETLNVAADGAITALTAAASDAPALIDSWLEANNAAAIQQAALKASGPVRKAARRALNVLKSKGVEIPPTSRRTSLVSSQARPVSAQMISPDGAGIRLLAFSRPNPGGSCQACLVYLRDGQGVVQVENLSSTPARLRDAIAKSLPGAGYDAVQVPVDWARSKVAAARVKHKERGIPEPLGFSSGSGLLEPVPTSSVEHPFDAEGFEFADEDALALASDSGALHHVPEFRSWLPTQQAVQEMLRAVGKHLDPNAPAEQEKVTELLKQEMLLSTDRYFTPDLRQELISWMKDAGISVLAREGEQTALKVAATIQVINNCGLVTNPPREVPFLCAFFEKAISVMMAQRGGKLDIPVPRPAPVET